MQFKYPFKLLLVVPFSLPFYFFFHQMVVLGNSLGSAYLIGPVLCETVES